MHRTFKALPLLLLLPVLVNAQTAPDSNADKRNTKATTSTAATYPVRNAATDTTKVQAVKTASSGQSETGKRKLRYSRVLDESRYIADNQDLVPVSEICTYSPYTYTYSCK